MKVEWQGPGRIELGFDAAPHAKGDIIEPGTVLDVEADIARNLIARDGWKQSKTSDAKRRREE